MRDGGGERGLLTDMLPNFYLFVPLHNGLGSLHGIRTGRATRATHATEATVNVQSGQSTRDNRKSTMHETATATATTTSAERQSGRRCGGEWECLTAINCARRIHGAGATNWCNPRSHPSFLPRFPRLSTARAYCVLCASLRCTLHAASCTAKAGKMLRASCA